MASQREPLTAGQTRLVASAFELAARGELSLGHPERIAANASMPADAVTAHFGDEAALLGGLLQWCVLRWSEQGSELRSLVDLSPGEFLSAHWHAWTAESANPRLLLLFVGQAASAPTSLERPVRAYRAQLLKYIEGVLTHFQEHGSIGPHVEVTSAAALLVRTWTGVATGIALDPARDVTTAFDDALTRLVASWQAEDPED